MNLKPIIRFLLNIITLLLFLFFFPTFHNCNYEKEKIIVLSDMHISGEFSSPLVIRIWNDFHLRRMIEEIKSKFKPKFFIHVGDLFHEGFFTYTSTARWKKYIGRLDYISQGTKIHSAVGNHDIGFPDRVTEKNLNTFSQIGYLDKVVFIDNITFQFVNSIIINKTLIIVPGAICIVHYPVVNLPKSLADKLGVCSKLYTGHDHEYKLFDSGKETNLPTFNPLQGSSFGFVIMDDFNQEKVCFGSSEKTFFSLLTLCTILLMCINFQVWDILSFIILVISLVLNGNALVVSSFVGYSFNLILPLFSNYKYIPQLLVITLIVCLYIQMGQLWNWNSEVYCSEPCNEYKLF